MLAKPNLHAYPIFKRTNRRDHHHGLGAAGGSRSTDHSHKRGPLLGLIQWTSDGEKMSAFGDDGLYKSGYKAHAAVMWRYTDILAPLLEHWLNDVVPAMVEN